MGNIFEPPQPYLTILYRAIFATAYFGLFRIGELTLSPHVVKAVDVHLGVNKRKMMFVLHSSKTHGRHCKPQIIKIVSEDIGDQKTNNPSKILHRLCPFTLLNDYIAVRKKQKSDNEQFFVFADRTAVTPVHFRAILKRLIIKIGLNPELYTSRGIRSGRATDLKDMGLSLESLKQIGRWRSTAVFTYLRA